MLVSMTTRLSDFVRHHPRLFVLTGAGCSTDSGIPDYRDGAGGWKRRQPMHYQRFVRSAGARRRYWARSLIGWSHFTAVRPNAGHRALADLQSQGCVHALVTQNVDGLHQAAGSRGVVDLHGRLERVVCLDCRIGYRRDAFQAELLARNPDWRDVDVDIAPDGDADLENVDFERFRVPPCPCCGGVLKPDVVFFGESVPKPRVARAMRALQSADAMLAVGTSMMVYSGFRFARAAARAGKPIAIVNRGRTRADELAALKIETSCAPLLEALADERHQAVSA